VRDSRVKCAEAPDIKRESSKTATRGLKGSQSPRGHPILHIPTPVLSKIQSKVNSSRRKLEIGENDKVSDVVMCRGSDVSKEPACYRLEDLILFASRWIYGCLMLSFLKTVESYKSQSSVDYRLPALHRVVADRNMCVILYLIQATHIAT
jgi:hypothetical protein